MALRDLLPGNKTKPTDPPKPPTSARGSSGRFHTNGFLDLEELNAELQGFQGLRVFDTMYRTDPDVRRVVDMCWNPIRGGTWEVEPFGADEADQADVDVADAVRWALFDFMRPGFKAHLSEACVVVRSGFCPFEQTWARATYEGKELLAPRKLGLRLPRSIQRWPQDQDGELEGVEQWTLGGVVFLPRQDLVYYRVGAEGDNWEGISLLRPVYKPWFIKDRVEKLDALAQQREAMGIPTVYPPNSDTSREQLDDLEEDLAKLQEGALGYLVMPGPHAQDVEEGGWRFEIQGFGASGTGQGAGRNAQNTLSYHSDKITAAFIAEFMRLGQAGEGARATADVQQDPFHAAVEALAGVIEDEINDSVVARFVALNFPDANGLPRLKMSKADSTSMSELATFVKTLADAQVLHPDNDLEDHMRKRSDLPPADPDARKQREEMDQQDRDLQVKSQQKQLEAPVVPPGGGGKPPGPKTAARTFARQTRPLRQWEQLMSLDLVEASIDNARAELEEACAPAVQAAAAHVAASVAAGQEPDLTPPDQLVEAIHDRLLTLYTVGRQTVDHELARQAGQRSTYTYALTPQVSGSLTARAALAAGSIVRRLYEAAQRRRMQGHTQPGEIQQAAEQEGAAATRFEAQMHAAAALNQGRSDEADAQADRIRGSRYTSILDGNRCTECAAADDDVLRPLTDPVRVARKPPNRDCHGGDRCRCLEFFELGDERPPSGPGGPPTPNPGPADPGPTDVADHIANDTEAGTLALDAINAVHGVHATEPIRPATMRLGEPGEMEPSRQGDYTPRTRAIRINPRAARPVKTAVHELGHYLDAEALPPPGTLSTRAGAGILDTWTSAIRQTGTYQRLVRLRDGEEHVRHLDGTTEPADARFVGLYLLDPAELWARAYTQWIARESGHAALEAQFQEEYDRVVTAGVDYPTCWPDEEFGPVAAAFDQLIEELGWPRR